MIGSQKTRNLQKRICQKRRVWKLRNQSSFNLKPEPDLEEISQDVQ